MTTPEPAPPGQLGDFVVVGVLGTGGSGVVLDARWGHREVALKVLHPTLVAGARERAQFLEEARRLQEISHPGVVKVLASGELPDGRPYLAMEKLAGPTLAVRLSAGPLAAAPAFTLFGQLARAVQALHDQGLVHRDLKPENVVLVGDAHAVLLDFGIAKHLAAPASTTTQDGGVRGTPAYMAPERFFGQPASVATDVYELAVTLYAMLAGKLPWADCGDPDVRLNPTPLGGNVVPAAVDVEIRRALSTRAQNRPASARELAAAVLGAAGVAPAAEPRTTTQVPLGAAPATGGAAWFERTSQRDAREPDKGTTPLAWAPTARAQRRAASGESRPRKWWPLAAAVVAVTAAIIGGIVVSGDDELRPAAKTAPGSGTAGSGATDPWADTARRPEPPAAPRPLPELRAEMVAGVGRLPADTRLVLALGVAEMRADMNLGRVLTAAAARPEVKLMFGTQDECPIGLADLDWVVFGFPAPDIQRQGDIVIRGRWTRDQLEQCLAAMSGGTGVEEAATKAKLFEGGLARYWVAFGDGLAVVSTRDDKTGLHVADLLARTAGPAKATGTLLAALDKDATMWIAIDPDPDGQMDLLDGIAPGTDAALWARSEDGGLRGQIFGRAKSVAAAKTSEAFMREKLDVVKKEGGDMLGRFELVRKDKALTLDVWIPQVTLGLAATALNQPQPP